MTASRLQCEVGECSNAAFGKVDGKWMCDDCRLERIREFMDLPSAERRTMRKVLVTVRGGVAEVAELAPGVEVEIRDYDVEATDDHLLEYDSDGKPYIRYFSAGGALNEDNPPKVR